MNNKFKKHINESINIKLDDTILVAASAGIDSCVLIDLLLKNNFKIAIAHCNFQLRGTESSDNHSFIEKIAKNNKLQFFSILFDTLKESKVRKQSIQMVARELRYEWFQKIAKDNNFKYIATGHHTNDSIETVILNLTKGTGIAGLHGIKPLNNNIIRPLLPFSREEILKYATTQSIEWQEDSSNISTKYARNLIRHEVIPILKKINPNLENTFTQTFEKINAIEKIFEKYVENKIIETVKIIQNEIYFDIEKLKNENSYVIYKLIENYGFNYYQSKELLLLLHKINCSGKILYSTDYQLIIDRLFFIISIKKPIIILETIINEPIFKIELHNQIITSEIIEINSFKLTKKNNICYFDLNEVKFPLKIRTWKHGDKIAPFGMKGKKNISDILIDYKIPQKEKSNFLVIEDADNEVISLVNLKASNKNKISLETKKVIKITSNFLK